MKSYNLAAIHDRIDEQQFEVRMQHHDVQSLQRRVAELERLVDQLRRAVFERDEVTGMLGHKPPPPRKKPVTRAS
jgi:Mg2+ and Co2+ transporter CorA